MTVVTNTAAVPNLVSKFVYDGDGARVMQIQISGTQIVTTAYAGMLEVQTLVPRLTACGSSAGVTATQRITKAYYSAGSQLVAMRVYTIPTSNVPYYLHADHSPSAPPLRGHGVGSTSLTTDRNDSLVARQLLRSAEERSGAGL